MSRWENEGLDQYPVEEERDEEELEGDWELDPNDPAHPDYDLSESAGYGAWEPSPKPLFLRRGAVLFITILVIVGLLIPWFVRLTF